MSGEAVIPEGATAAAAVGAAQGTQWTDDQWAAITTRGSDILVAAAAGSGKTAVLVERLIRRITDPEQQTDVDRLLVATFTKAAADEMRHRIREALERELERTPESKHLRRQLALVGRASITTLHSFCMEVVQRYSHMIGLDPGFRIAGDTEAALLRQDVLDALLERRYGESAAGDAFFALADSLGGERGDAALQALIERLYEFSRSHPWPDMWLEEAAGRFESGLHPIWEASVLQDVRSELEGVVQALGRAYALCMAPGGPEPYAETLAADLETVGQLVSAAASDSLQALYEAFGLSGFGTLKRVKSSEALDPGLQEQVKALRQLAKDRWSALREQLFAQPPEAYAEDVRRLAPVMRELVRLVLEFGEAYRLAKADKGLADFSDLEHFCLAILRDSAAGYGQEPAPSAAALAYREQFDEVMLDEYQDTNRVQETIVELLSRKSPGNRFMVGDVKQSIYKFRLAEPELFLAKYRQFGGDSSHGGGIRIDLARNFRSRSGVVDAVNDLFRQLMFERAAELDYDERAELVCGASYPDERFSERSLESELLLIDRSFEEPAASESSTDAETPEHDDEAEDGGWAEELRDTAAAQLEARLVAQRIAGLTGAEGGTPMKVYDRKKGLRTIEYRDIVILMRATEQWAPVFLEELRLAGIPAYAELSSGYFHATEVEVVMSLLRTIDNPLDDIPLAAVLRSPIVGLRADELARIRGARRTGAYYDAVVEAASGGEGELAEKLRKFLERLHSWRSDSRQGALAELIWRLYKETGYYDFVGGLPGGVQRQANLRALYDRARQYESTSLRGLFRFLRFIERMRDSGADLGAARALGEQENVVRLMTIHKSKGLEFPVVFVAGLGKKFNETDLNASFLLHKELGLGPRYFDPESRAAYPSFPSLAIRRRLRREMLAEELRVLYVALTRAKEKLILCASLSGLERSASKWAAALDSEGIPLAADQVLSGKCNADWIGAALMRHPHGGALRKLAGLAAEGHRLLEHSSSCWSIYTPSKELLPAQAAAAAEAADQAVLAALERAAPLPGPVSSAEQETLLRLDWTYPHLAATRLYSKTTISEMKRMSDKEGFAQAETSVPSGAQGLFRRPRFMTARKLTASERGVAYHTAMQNMPLREALSEPETVKAAIQSLAVRRLLTMEQAAVVDAEPIALFFRTPIGQRMQRAAAAVQREVPFSLAIRAEEAYPEEAAALRGDELVLVQGVIDCLFRDEQGLVLLDFKTDAAAGLVDETLADRYRLQLGVYCRAVETAVKRPVDELYLYFFEGSRLLQL